MCYSPYNYYIFITCLAAIFADGATVKTAVYYADGDIVCI